MHTKTRNRTNRRRLANIALLLLLTAALAFSAVSCRKPKTSFNENAQDFVPRPEADVTDLTVSRTLDSSDAIKEVSVSYPEDKALFTLKNAEADGNTVILAEQTVSSVALSRTFTEGTVAEYRMRVQLTSPKEDAAYTALFFGLRLPSVDTDATGKNGVWIALQMNKIGLRTGDWPNTKQVAFSVDGIDFSTERTLIITDDMARNVITFAAENDSGETVTFATFEIDGGTVSMYVPQAEKARATSKNNSIPASGCFRCWLHHMKGPAYIKDLTASGSIGNSAEAALPNMMTSRDVFADTWVAVDDENRDISGSAKRNNAFSDGKVGIFYFLWHDPVLHPGNRKLYDHSAAWYSGGRDELIKTLSDGPLGFAHYWAEPYFGYYRSDDEWIIRKHTYMLAAAGVDFIFIDATNGHTYENTYEKILAVWSQMRAEGLKTPQICFHCGINDDAAPRSFKALWNNLYSTDRYEDLWFKYDGKPLIFLPYALWNELPEEQKDFFTVRHSWANTKDSWYTDLDGAACWPWADMYPQGEGRSPDGALEQMIVMSGFWANGSYGTNAGRSYSYLNGGQPDDRNFGFGLTDNGTSGKGIAFEEQFDYAIAADPDVIMIVGWNEWWAGRWENNAAGQLICNTYTVTKNDRWTHNYFVDNFDPEYSRDIEPVKGLYNDNYYYQMVQNVRDYKGARSPLPASGQRDIDIYGALSQWYSVGPEYRDYEGDTAHRDSTSYVGGFEYKNYTGRNDFLTAKVSRSGSEIAFCAECAAEITAPEGTNWMNLFINADADYSTGWYGYELVLNRTRGDGTCSVMRFVDGSWNTEEIGSAALSVTGRVIQIKADATLLGLGDTFDFKWADNSVDTGDVMEFLDKGDAAPDGRFNYRYTSKTPALSVPERFTQDCIVLKAGSYYALVNGNEVRLDNTSTKAVFFGDDKALYVPKAFAAGTMKLDLTGAAVYNHYGIEYVDVAPLLPSSGRTVTRTDDMLILYSKEVGEDDQLMLYRTLH